MKGPVPRITAGDMESGLPRPPYRGPRWGEVGICFEAVQAGQSVCMNETTTGTGLLNA